MDDTQETIGDELGQLASLCSTEQITFERLLLALEEKGHAFIALFLAAPFLLPAIPGTPIPFGLALVCVGCQWSWGRAVWVPRRLRTRALPGPALAKFFNWAERGFRRVERLIRPRMSLIFHFEFLFGYLVALAGLLLALPMPPGTNLPPAAAVVFLALGVLQRDGLLVIAGISSLLVGGILIGLILYFGVDVLLSFFL